jgi:hypothetical protein
VVANEVDADGHLAGRARRARDNLQLQSTDPCFWAESAERHEMSTVLLEGIADDFQSTALNKFQVLQQYGQKPIKAVLRGSC